MKTVERQAGERERSLRVLIVDDEPLARDRLRDLLAREPGVCVVGECADGRSAVDAVRQNTPDLCFLDVQMPAMNGFDVLTELAPHETPVIVFVTAFDQYALRAFEVHALDYLLKPFDRERFEATLARARAVLTDGDSASFRRRVLQLLEERTSRAAPEAAAAPVWLQRLMVRTGGRVYFVRTSDVEWIEAAGNYVKLHFRGESHVIRDSLTALEKKLDPARFARIHRSAMVNIDRIEALEALFHGDYSVILQDGTKLTLSRFYRETVETRMGGRL